MICRTFAGDSDDVFTAATSIVEGGANTQLAVVKFDAAGDAAWQTVANGMIAGAWEYNMCGRDPSNRLVWSSNTGAANYAGTTVTSSDGWVCLAITKATGSVTPRAHIYKGGSWIHAAMSAAVPNLGNADAMRFGGNGTTAGDTLNGVLAFAAWFGSELSDANVEAAGLDANVALSLSPNAAWLFDQPTVSEPVLDLAAANDQTSRNNTTVTIENGPSWWRAPEGRVAVRQPGYSAHPKPNLRRAV